MGIGYKGRLLAHLKSDLQYFKKMTTGKIVITGRKSYDSIVNQLGHALPNRTNLVLSTKKKYTPNDPETHVYHSVEDIIHEYRDYGEGETEVMVAGGGEIYKAFLPHADKIYLNIIQHSFEKVDTYFPKFDESEWDNKCLGYQKADENNEYPFYIMEYTKKQSN